MQTRHHARLALLLLTALNFLNYIDRSVLFAVQPLVQAEFHRSDADFGFLTTAFFLCYMFAAPIVGVLADRYPRKLIIITGAIVWSAATLLTAVTHDFHTLLFRHAIVGIGEATFVTIAPAFLADLFGEERRGRIMGLFFMAIPAGTALGYVLGGQLGPQYGWRTPFYVAAIPGLLLALGMLFIPEPKRGSCDRLHESVERGTLRGLLRNPAFWTATLGMAAMTFALGGLSVWMPTFLSRMRGYSLARANQIFGGMTACNGIAATLTGGWLGDRLLRRTAGAYYLVSAASMALAIPAMILALYSKSSLMLPGIFVAEFLLLLNTGPLNAAVVNSVGAHIRATTIAVNIFTIHLLGDALSPTVIGAISDRRSLEWGFAPAVVAIVLSSVILFYGMRFAPKLGSGANPGDAISGATAG
ncbi:MAG TPA: MFS transporter [Terriglobales bacterium]|nr:MFS transporter [Terriglobales bacterium]